MDACDPHWKEEERESECYKRNFVEPGPRVCRGHSTAKQPQSQGAPNPSHRCARSRGGDSHLQGSIATSGPHKDSARVRLLGEVRRVRKTSRNSAGLAFE